MSNISPFTGNMAPPAAPPRQFVINFIRRAPRERYSNLLFENYQRLVDSMTPSELGLAVSSMSSNELYAVSQENQDEFQNPDFLLQLITAGAVPEDKLDAYKDRRAYQRIKDSFAEFTADGRISPAYVDSILRTVSEAIKMADRKRDDEDFTTAIFSGTYGLAETPEETQADGGDGRQRAL